MHERAALYGGSPRRRTGCRRRVSGHGPVAPPTRRPSCDPGGVCRRPGPRASGLLGAPAYCRRHRGRRRRTFVGTPGRIRTCDTRFRNCLGGQFSTGPSGADRTHRRRSKAGFACTPRTVLHSVSHPETARPGPKDGTKDGTLFLSNEARFLARGVSPAAPRSRLSTDPDSATSNTWQALECESCARGRASSSGA